MVEEFRSALSRREVPMVEPEAVARIRGLRAAGWGAKRIAREMKMRRNTVRRYLKGGERAEVQVRPGARRLDDSERRRAEELFAGEAAGNAVVVRELLMARGVAASVLFSWRCWAFRGAFSCGQCSLSARVNGCLGLRRPSGISVA